MATFLIFMMLIMTVLGSENMKEVNTHRVISYHWLDDTEHHPDTSFQEFLSDMDHTSKTSNGNQGRAFQINPSILHFGNFPAFSSPRSGTYGHIPRMPSHGTFYNYNSNNSGGTRFNFGIPRSGNRPLQPLLVPYLFTPSNRSTSHRPFHSSGDRILAKPLFNFGPDSKHYDPNSHLPILSRPGKRLNSFTTFKTDSTFGNGGKSGPNFGFNLDNFFNRGNKNGFTPYNFNIDNGYKMVLREGPNSRSFNRENYFKKGNTYAHNKAVGWSKTYSTSAGTEPDGSKFMSDIKHQIDDFLRSLR